MKRLMILCAAMTALGFSASAQSTDTIKVCAVDTTARPNPMILWDIPKMPPPAPDTVIFSEDSIYEIRIYRTPHGVEEDSIYHGKNVVGQQNPQEMKIEGVEVKVKY